jgi:2-oxoglutarate ferredoxin oxidoreductase subunit beta
MRAKKKLRRAFEVQINHEGFGFVEFLSACPTNWKMSPKQATKRVKEELIPYFPLGVFKDGRE